MSPLPTGTVTFFFSDIEGSTKLIQELGPDYPAALLAHHTIQRQALAENGGNELRTEGDSFFIVFGSALHACAGAAAVQKKLAEHSWPKGATVRVRIGLHTGEAALVGTEYLGLEVHRAARIASAAHGGQVLLSETTRSLVEDALPPELSVKDLGVHRLKDLARAERLFQLCIDGLPHEFPALRTIESTPNNLPTQLTSFIGRDDQVREVKDLLKRSRLLTLTGPGGTGKTRLSLQIAVELLDRFPDGVFFVPLAAVHDPDLVPSAIAQALAIQTTGNRRPIDALVEYLHDKQTLLVLDNFEQLLPAAPVTATLLEGSPNLRVLVSSRSVLRVYGEQEFPVPPLGLPDHKGVANLLTLSQFEAVRLFIERAVAAKPDFQATNDNAPAIAGICERVDGLPLAIELAAARIKLFSPQALLARLEKSLSALGTGARDAPSRQQTLRSAIQWSYDLLDYSGRRLFERFSVFSRGAALEQAEAVCGDDIDVLDGLDQLADQSLVRRQPDFSEPRFLMLQTIKEFARDQLDRGGEAIAVRDRHLDAYMKLAEQAKPHFFGPERREWLDRLQLDDDNFRSALEWAIASGNAPKALTLAALLWRFWQMRGHIHEGRNRMAAVLAMPDAADHPAERLAALEASGSLAYWQADTDAAQGFYDEALKLTRQIGDKRAIANALYNDGFPALVQRVNLDRGRTLFQEAIPLFRELGDSSGLARAFWALGTGLYYSGDFAAAKDLLQQSERLCRELNDEFQLGWTLQLLGFVAFRTGDIEAADRAFTESLELFDRAQDLSGIAFQLDNLSAVARARGDAVRATRLAGAAARQRATSGALLAGRVSELESRNPREGLDEADGEKAWNEGQAMTVEQAVAYALERESVPLDRHG